MMLNRGELDGVRLLGRKTVELMTMNHLPAGMHPFAHPWWGFGLGVAVLIDLARYQALGSVGTYEWGGLPSTEFWVDPREELIGVLMVQIIPDDAYPIQNDFRAMTYQAIVD
jgi:CubicO group peptidase (beta-lactamase class C family)